MRSAYVALVSSHGLESLLPENDATRRWSLQASGRHGACCLWAHVDTQLAAELTLLLADGESQAALRCLTAGADAVGPLI